MQWTANIINDERMKEKQTRKGVREVFIFRFQALRDRFHRSGLKSVGILFSNLK